MSKALSPVVRGPAMMSHVSTRPRSLESAVQVVSVSSRWSFVIITLFNCNQKGNINNIIIIIFFLYVPYP